jgi:hypothetical protein
MPLGTGELNEVSSVHGTQQNFATCGIGEFVSGGLPPDLDREYRR